MAVHGGKTCVPFGCTMEVDVSDYGCTRDIGVRDSGSNREVGMRGQNIKVKL